MKSMKKMKLVSALLVLFALGCKSTASGTPEESNEEPVSKSEQEDINDAFQDVYKAFKAGLILDGATTYTVVKGDTLTGIAKKVWKNKSGGYDPYYFPVFILASDEEITDPDLIEPGMKLTIPQLSVNLDDPSARKNIKDFLKAIADVYASTKSNKSYAANMVRHLNELSDNL